MILFDYIYYFFCNLYRLSKDERESGEFKASGCTVGGGSITLFLMPIMLLVDENYGTSLLGKSTIIILLLITIPFFWIRYKKITSYERIDKRIKRLSKTSILLLNIFLYTYLAAIIVGLLYVLYIAYTDPIAKRGLSA